MITNTGSHASHSRYSEEHNLAIRTTVELKKRSHVLGSGHRITTWLTTLLTALIGAAALVPNAFGIPADLQPWVFLASIFWIFAFCAGMFDF